MKTEKLTLCRYNGLDMLKAICAFLIVCIHSPFQGEMGQYIVALSRIAVPVFFIITGFFYDEIAAEKKTGKQIKKIAVLFIEANVLFCVWKMILASLSSGGGVTGISSGYNYGQINLKICLA